MRWIIASPFILIGLVCHLTTLVVSIRTMSECLTHGQFGRRSGLVVVGPILLAISAAIVGIRSLWWLPGIVLLIEILVLALSVGVIRATKSRPRSS